MKDFLYAVRMLRKNPGFVVVAVCSLAIGIGANSAIYSFADALLLRPLPVFEPSRVITVTAVNPGLFGAQSSISYPDYVDLRDRNHTFNGVVASSYAQFGFTPDRKIQPHMKFGMFVSGNFFKVLGIEPRLGRAFRADEDSAPGRDAVAVLSHELWAGEFGSNPDVIGKKIWLSGTEFTVIGIAPESFRGVDQLKPALYVPLAMAATVSSPKSLTDRDNRWLQLKGRLKPGMNVSQARADVEGIAGALRQMYPKTDENLRLKAETTLQAHLEQSPPDTALIVMLGLLALCVLLVACANVAGLLLSRATIRSREMAVRLSVGAARWSLIRQLLVESLLLAMAGGAAGLLAAYGADVFFNTLQIPTDIPIDLTARLDGRALVFTFLVALAATLLFGVVPALRSTKVDLISALKERDATASGSTRLWGRNLIVSGQVALSLVLLIVSGVLLDGFNSQLRKGPGFRVDRLQLMDFDPGLVHYSETRRDGFYQELLDKAKLAPGVESAALSSGIPMSPGGIGSINAVPEGRELKRGERVPDTFDDVVSPDYFRTMAIPIVQGRPFLETDKEKTTAVAIVNEHMAQHYWPNQNPLGKRIRIEGTPPRLVQIVGIAKMSKYLWISESPMDYLYLPLAQNPQPTMFLIAQSKGPDAASLVPVLRNVVRSIDWNMPVFDVRTMASLYQTRAVATPNIISHIVGGMGVMGLVLSVIGLYGVVSYSVSRRVREFGVRMAVGADRAKVIGMVLKQGAVLGVSGIVVGLAIGICACRAITSMLVFSFDRIGTGPFFAVTALLLITTTIGAFIPARRASRIDPMRALRDE